MTWHIRLAQARKNKHLGKSELARAVAVAPSSVTMWENGQVKMIEGENLMRVCAVLGVSARWLMSGDDVESQPPATPVRRLQWIDDSEYSVLHAYRATDDAGRRMIRAMCDGVIKTATQAAHQS